MAPPEARATIPPRGGCSGRVQPLPRQQKTIHQHLAQDWRFGKVAIPGKVPGMAVADGAAAANKNMNSFSTDLKFDNFLKHDTKLLVLVWADQVAPASLQALAERTGLASSLVSAVPARGQVSGGAGCDARLRRIR